MLAFLRFATEGGDAVFKCDFAFGGNKFPRHQPRRQFEQNRFIIRLASRDARVQMEANHRLGGGVGRLAIMAQNVLSFERLPIGAEKNFALMENAEWLAIAVMGSNPKNPPPRRADLGIDGTGLARVGDGCVDLTHIDLVNAEGGMGGGAVNQCGQFGVAGGERV